MKLINNGEGRTLYLHQSDVGTLRMCPEQARLQLTGKYFDPDSDVAHIGTRVHSFIEYCLHYCKDNGAWPDPTHLEAAVTREAELLKSAWPTLWTKPHMIDSLSTAVTQMEDCCLRWFNGMLPRIDTSNLEGWEIEKRFDVLILQQGNDQVRLRGSIDFYDGNGTIWDWKTGRFDKKDAWKKDRYDCQAPIYTYSKHLETGMPVIRFNFGFIPRTGDGYKPTRDPNHHLVHEMELTTSKWEMMLAEVLSWGKTILKLGVDDPWPLGPDDWHCSPRWCSEFALGRCRGEHEESFWPGEQNNIVELKRKVDAGLLPAPKEHHPDE